jgi:hypothetical protein
MKGQEAFGEQVWTALCERPLGSLTKRGLELLLLRSAIATDLLHPFAWQVAQKFRLSLPRAHGYLTDLVLRLPELDDVEGVTRLMTALRRSEVTPYGNHLALPLYDASLRIWIERKLSTLSLHPGESIRRELVRMTAVALCRILDASDGLQKPYAALDTFPKQFKKEPWSISAKEQWEPTTPWGDALKNVGISSLGTVIPKLLSGMTGIPFA